MRTSTMLLAPLAVLLAACSPDGADPTAPRAALSALGEASASRAEATRRPISGTCVSQDVQLPRVQFPFIDQVITGTCQLSHLGRADLALTQRVNLTDGTVIGDAVFTTVNGDVLRATTFSNTSTQTSPTRRTFVAWNTFTGGTGRFAGAQGEMRLDGTIDFVEGLGYATTHYEGWIAYDASGKSGS